MANGPFKFQKILTMIRKKINLTFLLLMISLFSCCNLNLVKQKNTDQFNAIEEVTIVEIPLEGTISERSSELSGLCWYGDYLILLPQYPNNLIDSSQGVIYSIKKNKIYDFLSGDLTKPLNAEIFSINTNIISEMFKQGSGFEALTIDNNTIFFTIEKMDNGIMESFLISGKIDSISKNILLDKKTLTKIEQNLNIDNMADESILFYNNLLFPIYEANGINVNPNSEVSIFTSDVRFIRKIKFPNIEYRITDVTSVDEEGNFWAINYFFPGEQEKLNPAQDKIAKKYGLGRTHLNYKSVERLLKFKIENDIISLVDQEPIYIQLDSNKGRNWEGIVKFDNNGFLLVTDTFPKTILAYIPVQ